MNVLHLSSDFSKQKLYKNLALSLFRSCSDLKQKIFVPVRDNSELGKNQINESRIEIKYKHILTRIDRLFYYTKINKVFRSLTENYDIEEFDICHAHFLFSDGGVAYSLKKKFGLPYVVAVRNTDVNIFFRFAIHLRRFGISILREADAIVFVSPAFIGEVKKYLTVEEYKKIESKIKIVPNVIDQFWYENIGAPKLMTDEVFKLLYVGDFTPNKNVPYLIRMKQKYFPDSVLYIVGGGGKDEMKVQNLCSNDANLEFVGRLKNRSELQAYYVKSNILCILSKRETFGLSYIESLSQGTPILFTKNQGVDGCFDAPVGCAVEYRNEKSLVDSVNKVLDNYEEYSMNSVNAVQNFKWDIISSEYMKIYDRITRKL